MRCVDTINSDGTITTSCYHEEVLVAADEAVKAAWPSTFAPIGSASYPQLWQRLIEARDRYAKLRGLNVLPR